MFISTKKGNVELLQPLRNCRQNWRQKHFELRIVKYATTLLFILVLLPVLCSSFLLNRALSFVLR